MAQTFKPAANTLARVSIVIAVLAPAAVMFAASTVTRSSYNTKVDLPLDQPVPFSHMHHVEELGIDCRYCHSTVEKSATAGVPTTQTCMACHSQIWTDSPLLEPVRLSYRDGTPIKWTLVNSVPDFVFFNHSIHVAKGVGCNVCHGAVNKMMITSKGVAFQMSWCLNCHRNPEQFLRPRDQVFNMNYVAPVDQLELGKKLVRENHVKKEQLTDCSVCHR